MIFSRWKADGGYDYFATTARKALGTDLPTPRLPQTSPIGVASTDIGRPMPAGARYIGTGELARGRVVGMSLSGMGTTNMSTVEIAALLGFFAIGWALRGYWSEA